jgi:hypothetical protein
MNFETATGKAIAQAQDLIKKPQVAEKKAPPKQDTAKSSEEARQANAKLKTITKTKTESKWERVGRLFAKLKAEGLH